MPFEKQPKVENPAEQENLEDAYKQDKGLWVPKEERGNVRSREKFGVELSQADKDEKAREYEREAEEERELMIQESKLKFTDKRAAWQESAETVQQVKEVEEAKIPEKSMPVEEILKEVDIEKPSKSLEEAEKGLAEKLEKMRTDGGEKISLAEKNETTLNFYLGELGYSVKYNFLHSKAELLDEKNESVKDENGQPMEFKTFFKMNREDTPLIDFLKEKLKEKYEGKPAKELSKEEEAEKGFEKAKKTTEQKQETRKEKISSLSEAKKVGQERLAKAVEKFSDVLSYLFVPDKLAALGLKEGKKMAVENGKDLLAADLAPLSLIEQAVRRVFGFIQTEGAIRKRITGKEGLEVLRGMSIESRPEDYKERIAEFRSSIEKGGQQLLKGQEKIHKKGKLARLIEVLQGEKK